MPLIDIHVLEGVFDADEKARMIAAVTDGFGKVAGPHLAKATSLRIHEVPSGAWGYSGAPMTTEDALRIRRGG